MVPCPRPPSYNVRVRPIRLLSAPLMPAGWSSCLLSSDPDSTEQQQQQQQQQRPGQQAPRHRPPHLRFTLELGPPGDPADSFFRRLASDPVLRLAVPPVPPARSPLRPEP